MVDLIKSMCMAAGGIWLCLKFGFDWQVMCIVFLLWISVAG